MNIQPGFTFKRKASGYGSGAYALTLEVVEIQDDGPFGVKCRQIGERTEGNWHFIGLETLQGADIKVISGGE